MRNSSVSKQPIKNQNKRNIDFTIEKQGLIKLNKSIVLKSIPGGFYQPIHFQNRYISIKSLLEKIDAPVLPSDQYFPLEKWNPGFQKVDEQISGFIRAKDSFKKRGLPYHRNLLLYGDRGTGKSTYLIQKCRDLVEKREALVIKIDNYNRLKGFSKYLVDEINVINDRLKVLVIEDIEKFRDDHAKKEMLCLLNRKELSHNTLVLMTSTLPGAIPNRLLKSSSLINNMTGIFNKDFRSGFVESWFKFIVGKSLPVEEYAQPWYKNVQGKLAPVFLKDLFLSSLLNERSFQQGWDDMRTRKEQLGNQFGKALDLFDEELDTMTEQDLLDLMEALEA